MKNTKIISGFPGVGKSYMFNNNSKLTILDSDSSNFSWVKDDKGNNTSERNPNFPSNYVQHIKENIGKVDIIMVSSHDIVRKSLQDANINYTIVYPDISLKDEYIQRYKDRGSNEGFVTMINKNWSNFIVETEKETFPKKIVLCEGEFLADVINFII